MGVLNTLDYILFVIAMIGGIWGAIKGFIQEIATKFGYVVGFGLGLMFTSVLSPVFIKNFGFPNWFAAFVSYFIIFVAGYLLIKILGNVLDKITDTANLNFVDNILGFFIGLIETLIIIGFVEFILENQSLIPLKDVMDGSLFT
ncbi:MAG: CvpA family protein, partial [Sphaerochaetaceae bacterium]|nr:CvpA family protein [Sphaerochaetaceae bacterium]